MLTLVKAAGQWQPSNKAEKKHKYDKKHIGEQFLSYPVEVT